MVMQSSTIKSTTKEVCIAGWARFPSSTPDELSDSQPKVEDGHQRTTMLNHSTNSQMKPRC